MASTPVLVRRAAVLRGLPLALASLLAGCGGGAGGVAGASTSFPVNVSSSSLPADASAVRYHPIEHAAFGPIYGSGCPVNGRCGCGDAKSLVEEFSCQLDHLAANDIPISSYLFDGSAWSAGSVDDQGGCTGADCCSWKLGTPAIERLSSGGVRGLLHVWGGCTDDEQYARAYGQLGQNLLGFYLDDGSSDATLQDVSEFMQSVLPGNWECVAKAYENGEPTATTSGLSKWANVAYMGDLTNDFAGLKQAVTRVLAKAPYVPAPFAELTGYAYLDDSSPAQEVYYRRLQFGALQPVMAHTPYGNSDPWRPEYTPDLLQAYRYYAWLHKELRPYFYSYAYRMYEDPSQPALQAGPMTYSFLVGDELYAPIVTDSVQTMDIQLPPGQWIDYWDESRLASGTLAGYPIPLGREPIFIRQGAIIPMDVERSYTGHGTPESQGALTVLVYPSDNSSFRYRDDASSSWITFSSTLSGTQLTLTADASLPGRAVLYRIERWSQAPDSVAVDGAGVTVNQGGGLRPSASEAAANASPVSTWFYDAAAGRLIVKRVP